MQNIFSKNLLRVAGCRARKQPVETFLSSFSGEFNRVSCVFVPSEERERRKVSTFLQAGS